MGKPELTLQEVIDEISQTTISVYGNVADERYCNHMNFIMHYLEQIRDHHGIN